MIKIFFLNFKCLIQNDIKNKKFQNKKNHSELW